jgi:Protein of unknown function (DUF3102)
MTTSNDQNEEQEINKLYSELLDHVSAAKFKAMEIGELLTETKKQLTPDEWNPWLMTTVKFSERAAVNYIAANEGENFVLAVVDYVAVTCRSVCCECQAYVENDGLQKNQNRDKPNPHKNRAILQMMTKQSAAQIKVKKWLAIRKKAGRKIDPETAKVRWEYGQILDPYGVDPQLPEECYQIGRVYFARSPRSKIWVCFYDLPVATRDALRKKLATSLED